MMERPFTMTHCWDILKNEVKWLGLQNKPKPADGRSGPQDVDPLPNIDGNGSTGVHVDGGCSSPALTMGKWPIERDATKEARKRFSSSSNSQQSSSHFVLSMNDLQLERFTFMKESHEAREERMHNMMSIEERKVAAKKFMMKVEAEQINMERERLEILKQDKKMEVQMKYKMEEERILAIDLQQCNAAQQMYCKSLQDKTIGRLRSGCD